MMDHCRDNGRGEAEPAAVISFRFFMQRGMVKAVFDGTAPESLTLRKVMYVFPDDWEEQKRVFDLR